MPDHRVSLPETQDTPPGKAGWGGGGALSVESLLLTSFAIFETWNLSAFLCILGIVIHAMLGKSVISALCMGRERGTDEQTDRWSVRKTERDKDHMCIGEESKRKKSRRKS